jgi:hypothetical protein
MLNTLLCFKSSKHLCEAFGKTEMQISNEKSFTQKPVVGNSLPEFRNNLTTQSQFDLPIPDSSALVSRHFIVLFAIRLFQK